MIILNEKQLQHYLKSGETFTLAHEGKEYELSCQASMYFNCDNVEDERNGELTFDDYQIELEGEEVFSSAEFSDILGFFKTKELTVTKINSFSSMEEFLENRAFTQANMVTLLEKYADCDVFSLSAYVYEEEFPLAVDEKEELQRQIRAQFEKDARALYEGHRTEYALPPLEELLLTIRQECLLYEQRKVKKKGRKSFYSCSMICDEVGKSTRYAEPSSLFWYLYHRAGILLDRERELEEKKLRTQTCPLLELEEEEYAPLKPYLLKQELTYTTHCTDGGLQKVLYFPLNDQTKRWLLQRENDYDFHGALQDLAFYKQGKLRFSSCTHEGFHNDVQ